MLEGQDIITPAGAPGWKYVHRNSGTNKCSNVPLRCSSDGMPNKYMMPPDDTLDNEYDMGDSEDSEEHHIERGRVVRRRRKATQRPEARNCRPTYRLKIIELLIHRITVA